MKDETRKPETDFADLLAERGGSVGTIRVDGAPMTYWLPPGVTLADIRKQFEDARRSGARAGGEVAA